MRENGGNSCGDFEWTGWDVGVKVLEMSASWPKEQGRRHRVWEQGVPAGIGVERGANVEDRATGRAEKGGPGDPEAVGWTVEQRWMRR